MSGDLSKRSLSAVKWGASSTLLRFLLQITAQAVMARLLGPGAYGVFGVGLIVMALTSLLTDIGFSWNLLKKADLSDSDIQFALTGQIVFGVLLSILLYLGADFLAFHLAGEPVGWVIRLLAFSVVFNAAAGTPSILLSRALNYRHLGKIQLAGYVCGYFVVGIPMALADCGAIALVAAWLVQSLVRCWLAFRLCGLAWRPTFRHPSAGHFLAAGLLVFVTNVVNWLINNLDRVTVSRLMPSQALGIYNVSANLAGTPNAVLLSSIQPVFMSAGARLQNAAGLRIAYSGVLRAALLVVPAFYVGLALGSDDLIGLLYGEKWADAAPVATILFFGMPFFVVWSLSTPVLWNSGKSHQEALFQLPVLVFAGAAYFAFSNMGLVALAWTADLVLFLRATVVFMAARRCVSLDWRELLPAFWMGLAFSLCAAFSHWVVADIPMPGISRLLIAGISTLCACVALLKFLPGRPSSEAIETIGHVSHRAAGWLQGRGHARADAS